MFKSLIMWSLKCNGIFLYNNILVIADYFSTKEKRDKLVFIFSKVSCCQGQPQTSYILKNNLELLILQSLPIPLFWCRNYRHVPQSLAYIGLEIDQRLVVCQSSTYQMNYIFSPRKKILMEQLWHCLMHEITKFCHKELLFGLHQYPWFSNYITNLKCY